MLLLIKRIHDPQVNQTEYLGGTAYIASSRDRLHYCVRATPSYRSMKGGDSIACCIVHI
jgi:hypothetical protein